MFDLSGKTALVTGASGGLGGAIARAFHARGATVVLSGTREAALQQVAADLGERTHVAAADLSDAASVDGLIGRADFERLIEERPRLARGAIRMLCGRLRETTDQLESIALYRIEARLARLFLGMCRQVADLDAAETVKIRLDLNQSHLAEIVGASRPKVNRALLELESAGAVRRAGADLVCRIEALTEVAEAEEQAL